MKKAVVDTGVLFTHLPYKRFTYICIYIIHIYIYNIYIYIPYIYKYIYIYIHQTVLTVPGLNKPHCYRRGFVSYGKLAKGKVRTLFTPFLVPEFFSSFLNSNDLPLTDDSDQL